MIGCYEKVVRIPLEGDEIFRVHGERTLVAAKALMNTKVDGPRISDIPVSKEEHEVHLKLVLESLRKEKLYAKFSKYNSKERNSGDDQLRLIWMIYLVVLADAAEIVKDAIGFEYCLASSMWLGKRKSPVLWAEIRESSLIGPELVLETTDKVVLIKEKLKAARDRQKSYVDFRRKPLESEVGDRVLLKVSPWKGVVRFGKKGKLAPRYVGPFEILERIGLVAYRLRLPEELNSVHDTFHVSNLKKCLGNAIECCPRGSPAGIHGLFSGWYCGLAGMMVTLRVSMAGAKGVTTGTLVRYETSCGKSCNWIVLDWLCMLACNLLEDKEVRRSG
ncbi:hypothetical protein Tco_1361251 [Tanacetum coccineum]